MGSSESQCCSIYPATKESKSHAPRLADSAKNRFNPESSADGGNKSKLASLSLAEFQAFSDFVKDNYLSSGDAFDKMFKIESKSELGTAAHLLETQRVDRKMFEHRCAVAGYKGRAGLIFDLLKHGDDFITRGGFKFRMSLSPTVVIKTCQGTSYESPVAGKDPAFLSATFCTKETNCDELAKTEEALDKMNRQHSLGSASTAETSSESPRKSNLYPSRKSSTPPLPCKSGKTSIENLGPPPATNSRRKFSKILGPAPASDLSSRKFEEGSDVLGHQPGQSKWEVLRSRTSSTTASDVLGHRPGSVTTVKEDPATGACGDYRQPLYFSTGNGRKARPTPSPLDVACAFKQARGPYDRDLVGASPFW